MRVTAVLFLLAASVLADETLDALADLQKEYEAAVEEFYRPAREAHERGEKLQLDYSKHPNGIYAPRFLAFAKEHPKTEAAAKAFVMALKLTRTKEIQSDAKLALLRDHLESAALEDVVYSFRDDPAALRKLSEESPHRIVRGRALLVTAQQAMEDEQEGALAILREVKEKYADVPYFRGITLGQKADGCIFEIERLGIGKEAPDIEGVDLDGVAFKLSDYRGKVVVLDFWGDW